MAAMAAASPTTRRPFAELGVSRLQSLSSAKNCQNAVTDMLAFQGKDKSMHDSNSAATKRAFAPAIFNDDGEIDSENIDPAIFSSSKKSKRADGTPHKKLAQPLFTLSTDFSVGSSSTLLLPNQQQPYTPSSTSPLASKARRVDSPDHDMPNAPSYSAPAGRSPKHKRIGILSRKRPSFSPFKRIDPPSFLSGRSANGAPSALPFSIDAAINGTIANYSPAAGPSKAAKVCTLDESMPKGWFFSIHEDSPDEEAANIMEHSTCILDISSDDEAGPSTMKNERGKENIPPPDYASPERTSQSPAGFIKPRRSVHADDMVDVGVERSPLGDLPAEDFYGTGLDQNSVEIVNSDNETKEQEQENVSPPSNEPKPEPESGNSPTEDKPSSDESASSPVLSSPTDSALQQAKSDSEPNDIIVSEDSIATLSHDSLPLPAEIETTSKESADFLIAEDPTPEL